MNYPLKYQGKGNLIFKYFLIHVDKHLHGLALIMVCFYKFFKKEIEGAVDQFRDC